MCLTLFSDKFLDHKNMVCRDGRKEKKKKCLPGPKSYTADAREGRENPKQSEDRRRRVDLQNQVLQVTLFL